MIDFSLTDEQRAIQELARDFARREIRRLTIRRAFPAILRSLLASPLQPMQDVRTIAGYRIEKLAEGRPTGSRKISATY